MGYGTWNWVIPGCDRAPGPISLFHTPTAQIYLDAAISPVRPTVQPPYNYPLIGRVCFLSHHLQVEKCSVAFVVWRRLVSLAGEWLDVLVEEREMSAKLHLIPIVAVLNLLTFQCLIVLPKRSDINLIWEQCKCDSSQPPLGKATVYTQAT
jgi:hypothetical protein